MCGSAWCFGDLGLEWSVVRGVSCTISVRNAQYIGGYMDIDVI
jgi:hypothetical protein